MCMCTSISNFCKEICIYTLASVLEADSINLVKSWLEFDWVVSSWTPDIFLSISCHIWTIFPASRSNSSQSNSNEGILCSGDNNADCDICLEWDAVLAAAWQAGLGWDDDGRVSVNMWRDNCWLCACDSWHSIFNQSWPQLCYNWQLWIDAADLDTGCPITIPMTMMHMNIMSLYSASSGWPKPLNCFMSSWLFFDVLTHRHIFKPISQTQTAELKK